MTKRRKPSAQSYEWADVSDLMDLRNPCEMGFTFWGKDTPWVEVFPNQSTARRIEDRVPDKDIQKVKKVMARCIKKSLYPFGF